MFSDTITDTRKHIAVMSPNTIYNFAVVADSVGNPRGGVLPLLTITDFDHFDHFVHGVTITPREHVALNFDFNTDFAELFTMIANGNYNDDTFV